MNLRHPTGGDPLNLTLAADTRFSQPDFTDDQIWELRLQGGEPPALVLQTTYGLRARWMRIFPRFIRWDKTYCDPAQFHIAPQLIKVFPNYARLICSPFDGLEVQLEYWIPTSKAVACRIQLKNTSILKEPFRLEWAVLLSPLEEGVGMSPVKKDRTCYLCGQTSSLAPILLIEECSDARSGPFPALSLDLDLYPGNANTVKWACTALDHEEASLNLAHQILHERWEAQTARIELVNASQMVAIHTGREEWDSALSLSQVAAYGLIMPGNPAFPAPAFVLSRQPDHGYSFRGDGSDYSHLWKGQTTLDALYLASLILPGGTDLVKGLVENFLSVQDEQGRIDWRSAPAGQGNRYLAQPVLAGLAWQTSQYLGDGLAWLDEIYPKLLRFFNAWFEPGMDRDEDGFPEWEHPLQTGLEDLSLFDLWHPTAQGVEITTLEAPGLAAFLAREADALAHIARLTGRTEDLIVLEQRKLTLSAALQQAWDARSGLFRYRDTCSHHSPQGGLLKLLHGSGRFSLRRTFKAPRRIQLKLVPFEENTRAVTLRMTGTSAEGEVVEKIGPRRWTWSSYQARCTSQTLFRSLTQVEVEGAAPNDLISVERVDVRQEDISLFLPLWAGLCTRVQAKKMVEKALARSFMLRYGAPLCSLEQRSANPASLNGVSPLWVALLGEGLLSNGFRKEAAELFTRMMDGITISLKRYTSFWEYYDAKTGQPIGERNHLRGLAPVGFFLKLVGIQKLTQKEVILTNFNPFPLPVTVQYLGTTVVSRPAEAVVTFLTGESVCVSGPGPHRISLD